MVLNRLEHRNHSCVGIYYPPDEVINRVLLRIGFCYWSKTHACWYMVYDAANYALLLKELQKVARVEVSYTIASNQESKKKADTNNILVPIIGGVNAHVLDQIKEQLILKAYSKSTIKTYINEMRQFMVALREIPAEQIEPVHLKRYLVYCFEQLGLSENTLHSRMNAIKFYYEQVLYRERFFWEIPRPKKPWQLPKLLNEEELSRLFNALTN